MGRVASDERLARIVRSPRFYNPKTKAIKAGIFSLSEIRKSGISLIRIDKISRDELLDAALAVTMHAPEGGTLAGVGLLEASRIRAIICPKSERYLCVKDDPVVNQPPLPDNPAHALAEAARVLSEVEAIEIQTELKFIMGQLVEPIDIKSI